MDEIIDRIFYIDYEIDENKNLLELGKTIIEMNISEAAISTEELSPIYLFIDSYGGDLDQTLFFVDVCLTSRIPIITIGMSVCESSGFMLLLAGSTRYVFKHTELMCHAGSVKLKGSCGEVTDAYINYKKKLSTSDDYVCERTAITKEIMAEHDREDWYFSNSEIEKYGIAKIISSIEDIL